MTRERDVKKALLAAVDAAGGLARKVKWEGRSNAPDWRVLLPGRRPVWVELKAPGETPTTGQLREHERMRRFGEEVYVIDSIEMVRGFMEHWAP